MKRARAGERDRRITIEHFTEVQNTTFGGTDKTWATFKQKWAMIKPATRGIEQFDGAMVRSEKLSVFEIQFDSSITTKMRINYDGSIYNIRSIEEPAGYRKVLHHIYGESED